MSREVEEKKEDVSENVMVTLRRMVGKTKQKQEKRKEKSKRLREN